jgi:IclR family acetate operon transcriptional repressor
MVYTIKQKSSDMLDDDRYIIDILDVALDVIDTMASGQEEFFSTSVLARQFNMNRSRMFRIFKTLERRGFVIYDPKTETYRLGQKFLSIGQSIRSRISLRSEAEDVLKNLAAETGDCSYLIVLSGISAIVVDRYLGDNMLQLSAPIGSVLPVHTGAAPKILLAFMPEEQLNHILDEIPFSAFTPKTITNKDEFRKKLTEIRKQGFAEDDEDFEIGAYAFGAPVFNHEGNVVAGISISTPTARCSPKRREELIHIVCIAGKKLSERLGYQPDINLRS